MFEQPSLRVTILSIHTYLTSFQRWKISGASTTTSAWQATCLQAPTTAFSRLFVWIICKRCITKKSIWVSEWKTIHDILENTSYHHNYTQIHQLSTALKRLTPRQEGIFPDWEDEKNGPGGRWIINSDRWSPALLLWLSDQELSQ